MLQCLKKSIFIICCILTFANCNGQSKNKDFDLFLSNFVVFELPVNPAEILAERERKGNYQKVKILEKDYDKFLREKGDTFWAFKEPFEYCYLGKKIFDDYWMLLYYRGYLCDDVNLQKSEFVLTTFTLDGKMIASLPIAGGYGDSLVFSSMINSAADITVNYTLYRNNREDKYTKHYFISDGYIKSEEGY